MQPALPAIADNLGMGSVVWLLRIGALLLAFGAGWSFGRATPGWQIDKSNEDTERFRFGRFGWHYSDPRTYAGDSCFTGLTGFFQGALGTVLLALGAVALTVFAWFDLLYETAGRERGGLLAMWPYGLLLLAAVAGYITSRLTDKGPMGPLE